MRRGELESQGGWAARKRRMNEEIMYDETGNGYFAGSKKESLDERLVAFQVHGRTKSNDGTFRR